MSFEVVLRAPIRSAKIPRSYIDPSASDPEPIRARIGVAGRRVAILREFSAERRVASGCAREHAGGDLESVAEVVPCHCVVILLE